MAENYRRFARIEVAGKSPRYQDLCEGVAGDREMIEFLSGLPTPKRQPNLLLAAGRLLFGLAPNYAEFRDTVLQHRDEMAQVLLSRRTQTNEPGRCAALLPVFCRLRQPLALLEVGASAGLCLLIDRYGYDYGGKRLGDDRVVFPCVAHGAVPVPDHLPEVVWRAGIDLEPIDLDDADAVRWLEALVWPEERDRLERLRVAIEIGREERPRIVRGDLLEELGDLAAEAPDEATLVVFHTSVLSYLSEPDRKRFKAQVRQTSAKWISSESSGVVAGLQLPSVTPVAPSYHVIAVDGRRPIAFCDSHGRWLQWL